MEHPYNAAKILERRSKPRIGCSYPAIVQGRDVCGRKFRTNATLTNISATGLCLYIKSEFHPASDLFVLFRCSSTGPLYQGSRAPLIACDGNIVRTSSPTEGECEVAVKIRCNRFL